MSALLLLTSCTKTSFVKTSGSQFILDGKPYYYIGTNAWYLPILASDGAGGDHQRLTRELDALDQMGVRNVRVLVGADGVPTARKVQPVLQTAPGIYNDTLLVGLDRLMTELEKRGMKAVLYLNNSWSWSGGYAAYLRWSGTFEEEPVDSMNWVKWCAAAAHFAQDPEAHRLFLCHVERMVSRRNTITGRPYAEDPTIMAWQIGNEPRAFSDASKEPFAQWVAETAALIKRLDHNHLVSVGSEGTVGCEQDKDLYERLHADPNIDYLTAHIWPQNWGWVERGKVATKEQDSLMQQQLEAVNNETEAYIRIHTDLARTLNKPLVIEEFGYPRDANQFSHQASTCARDIYYRFMFQHVIDSKKASDVLAGVNFWGWNGEARARHLWWEPYDPYMADPAQEEQGLYGVFDSDSTCLIIREAVSALDSSE